jgi:nitrite reductase/ring-hydroxylating ferredoxin subunit
MGEPDASAPGVPLGDLSDLHDGELRGFGHVGRDGIVVCRVGGRLYALDDNCSHADTPLSEGRLHGYVLVCPLHGAAFDVRDGSHTGPPAWEGVVAHEVVEHDGSARVVLGGRAARSHVRSADGSHQRTR